MAFRNKMLSKRRKRMDVEIENPVSKKKIILNNGVQMPAIGLGTYRIRDEGELTRCMDIALGAGYRMFDTAAVFRNEAQVGEALKVLLPKYHLEREDVFIITKLNPQHHGGGQITYKSFMRSLEKLNLEYVDMFMIHFPGTPQMPARDERNRDCRHSTWKTLEKLYDNGKVNSIGVSNFTVQHLDDLITKTNRVVPAVNQVEWHPYLQNEEMLDFCRKNDIVLQAYSSLGGASLSDNTLLKDPVVKKIATKLGVTEAQILLGWAVQQDISIIPKSVHPNRIIENIDLNFTISPSDMNLLTALSENNIKYSWNPSSVA